MPAGGGRRPLLRLLPERAVALGLVQGLEELAHSRKRSRALRAMDKRADVEVS